jgi:outer membrane usher protein
VTVNGKLVSAFADAVRTQDGRYLVTADILRDARVSQLPAPAKTVEGQDYYAVDALPGAQSQFDEDQQTLALRIPAADFAAKVIDGRFRPRYTPSPPPFGFFLNHDMTFARTARNQSVGGILETGMFNPLGVFTNDMESANLLTGAAMQRLDTRFTKEMPGHLKVLTVGDTLSSSDTWAESVHYAGIQYASNFTVQPGYLPYALPAMQGQAAEPSVVDIYVNSLLTMKQPVDAGPFTVQNIPVITPEGNMSMVITDMMGHQQVISGNYLSVNTLLRQGVSAYTGEGGVMRWGEGTPSDSYHTLFGVGDYQYGVKNNLTVSARSEILGANQTFGAGSEAGIPRFGVLGGNLAVSHSAAGTGELGYGMLQHQTRGWGLAGTILFAGSSFRQLGLLPGQLAPRLQAQAQLGRSFGRSANVGVGYLLRECQGEVQCTAQLQHLSALTVSWGTRLWSWGVLGGSATYSPAVQQGTALALTLSIPLQHLRNIMASTAIARGDSSGLVEIQQSLPRGEGYGYRARFNSDDTDVAGELDYGGRYGTYSLALERSVNGTEASGEERGGIAFLGGEVMPTRWIDGSFAMVDVPNQPGIRVYANNQYITTTDGRGKAIVPLAPLDSNTVSLDDKDVPVQIAMDFSQRQVVPFSHTGMLVRFNAEVTQGATLVLQQAGGAFVPLGSQVTVPGSTEVYEVAYDGEVFIQNLATPTQLHVQGPGFTCDVTVPKAPPNVDLPRIGPLVCSAK